MQMRCNIIYDFTAVVLDEPCACSDECVTSNAICDKTNSVCTCDEGFFQHEGSCNTGNIDKQK